MWQAILDNTAQFDKQVNLDPDLLEVHNSAELLRRSSSLLCQALEWCAQRSQAEVFAEREKVITWIENISEQIIEKGHNDTW